MDAPSASLKPLPPTTASPDVSGDLAGLLAALLAGPGRREYRLVMEDERFVALTATSTTDDPFFDREELANILGCHPDTVSRDRKKLEAEGLVGRKLAGRRIRWRKDQTIAYAERKGLTGKRRPGRPPLRP